ncbi:MAG TPA: putative aminohydrolase SsnA [Anaerolineae bacterium]|nr:putative aminohydrolase SsnA [Anaerolineae bacterium]
MIIKNANLITFEKPNRILANSSILIKNGKINQINKGGFLIDKFPKEDVIDAQGQYVMPGNICAHTHFYGAFARGMAIPCDAPANFPEILDKLWWKLDKSLDYEAVYYSALVCMIDAIKHGTTTLIDHHSSPNAIEGSLDEIARAVSETGVRASLCYEVTDRNGSDKAQAGIRENIRFITKTKNHNQNGKLFTSFGLHASLTLSKKTLEKAKEAVPADSGFHIHVAEHPIDEYDSINKSGKRVVERLYDHGILGPRTIVVHAVHIDAKELFLLKDTGTWVSHQPRSNMNNAVGLPVVESMMNAGVKVCLGNDGFSNAMWQEWKATYLAHKLWNADPRRMGANIVIQMGVYNNAKLVKQLTDGLEVGVIKEGAEADLIFVDYKPITPLYPENLPWHIIFGFRDSMVTTTIVDGKVLMNDREMVNIDECEINEKARKIAMNVWEMYAKQF